jgi:hypothetical protein
LGIDGGVAPVPVCAAHSGDDATVEELSRKMLTWSTLWFGTSENCPLDEKHSLVRQRLLSLLKRCIGCKASGVLPSGGENISLASSAPLLTAFLGRRAMRELSRRVLNNL